MSELTATHYGRRHLRWGMSGWLDGWTVLRKQYNHCNESLSFWTQQQLEKLIYKIEPNQTKGTFGRVQFQSIPEPAAIFCAVLVMFGNKSPEPC